MIFRILTVFDYNLVVLSNEVRLMGFYTGICSFCIALLKQVDKETSPSEEDEDDFVQKARPRLPICCLLILFAYLSQFSSI